MKTLVTGGCGFIGRHVVRELLHGGEMVMIYDRSPRPLSEIAGEPLKFWKQVHYFSQDLADFDTLCSAMAGCDMVFHFAAHSDVRAGAEGKDVDLHDGILATWNVLMAMRKTGVKKLIFPSSSVMYGMARDDRPFYETDPPHPISVYGAAKAAAEAMISAFCHTFDARAWIFRLANIVGPNMTHGVLWDFREKLRQNPARLEVLGNGKQEKSYLHVTDCVNGIFLAIERAKSGGTWNLTTPDTLDVATIAQIMAERFGQETEITFTGGDAGWVGDVPVVRMSGDAMRGLGWAPLLDTSLKAILRTVGDGLK